VIASRYCTECFGRDFGEGRDVGVGHRIWAKPAHKGDGASLSGAEREGGRSGTGGLWFVTRCLRGLT
jgi:hypothetical protein